MVKKTTIWDAPGNNLKNKEAIIFVCNIILLFIIFSITNSICPNSGYDALKCNKKYNELFVGILLACHVILLFFKGEKNNTPQKTLGILNIVFVVIVYFIYSFFNSVGKTGLWG